MSKIEKFCSFITESKKICVFTGAGISCASGIPDFRSADGLYNQSSGTSYRPEEIISHHFFLKYTKEFYSFYRSKMLYPNAKPNKAHLFFALLQKDKDVTVVTQNIDGLHQMAGSKRVLELHGSVLRNYCMDCNRFYSIDKVIQNEPIPICPSCGGIIKPDVVLYEEPLDEEVINNSIAAISEADCLIIIGTSLTVYPAASFVRFYRGSKLVLINKQATQYDSRADLVFNEDVIDVVMESTQLLNKGEK